MNSRAAGFLFGLSIVFVSAGGALLLGAYLLARYAA